MARQNKKSFDSSFSPKPSHIADDQDCSDDEYEYVKTKKPKLSSAPVAKNTMTLMEKQSLDLSVAEGRTPAKKRSPGSNAYSDDEVTRILWSLYHMKEKQNSADLANVVKSQIPGSQKTAGQFKQKIESVREMLVRKLNPAMDLELESKGIRRYCGFY